MWKITQYSLQVAFLKHFYDNTNSMLEYDNFINCDVTFLHVFIFLNVFNIEIYSKNLKCFLSTIQGLNSTLVTTHFTVEQFHKVLVLMLQNE